MFSCLLLVVCYVSCRHALRRCHMSSRAGRWGGAITAALFLQEFIEEGTQWAHLDVAGPAWDDAACLPTGFGAATLAQWVDGLAASLNLQSEATQ